LHKRGKRSQLGVGGGHGPQSDPAPQAMTDCPAMAQCACLFVYDGAMERPADHLLSCVARGAWRFCPYCGEPLDETPDPRQPDALTIATMRAAGALWNEIGPHFGYSPGGSTMHEILSHACWPIGEARCAAAGDPPSQTYRYALPRHGRAQLAWLCRALDDPAERAMLAAYEATLTGRGRPPRLSH
jgi:hypothetical protein